MIFVGVVAEQDENVPRNHCASTHHPRPESFSFLGLLEWEDVKERYVVQMSVESPDEEVRLWSSRSVMIESGGRWACRGES